MTQMTSMQRVLTALGHQEPDRVPFFLLLSMHGAKELGLTLKDYYSNAENIVEGQLRLRKKYQHDNIYAFFYAAIETEAWGGEAIFIEDGPPNAGAPIIKKPEDITALSPPEVASSEKLQVVLEAIEKLKEKVGDEAPIIGVAISPFSLPVMQIGFEGYLNLIIERPEMFEQLMKINQKFSVDWANAQLRAGATAICYFDPVSSPTIITPEMYSTTGFKIASAALPQINGPTATHMASGRCLPIIDKLIETGTEMVGVSTLEDLAEIKKRAAGKVTVFGNLNGVEMRRWTEDEAAARVREAIDAAAAGGGFILSDNHGEIPFQVPDDVLTAISETARDYGRYTD